MSDDYFDDIPRQARRPRPPRRDGDTSRNNPSSAGRHGQAAQPHVSRARQGGSARPLPPQRERAARPAPLAETRALPAYEQPTRQNPRGPQRKGRPQAVRHRPGAAPLPAPAAAEYDEAGVAEQGRVPRPRRHRVPRWGRLAITLSVLFALVTVFWFGGLTVWANSRLHHVAALSEMADTPGETFLIAGSDSRDHSTAVGADGTVGQRADTIMLLHKAPNGNSYLVSLPRDTLVNIPGKGYYKLNAAYAFGGAKLLVATVEQLTGLKVDHFIEVGFDGVRDIVNAVGTVKLCIGQDVDDVKSGLKMKKGCHETGGDQALAFVRARYFDPTADLGRQKRQQQFVAALTKKALTPGLIFNPFAQVRLVSAATGAISVDDDSGVLTLASAGYAFRSAANDHLVLQMPIDNPNYRTKHSGVAIKINEPLVREFFAKIGDGSAEAPSGQ
ncbi:LCP family protein [Dermabacteraceae bacterium P13077]